MTTSPADAKACDVVLDGITVRAGSRVLLQAASACFAAGKITLIVGPSGAGKSVLLRVLAGLAEDESQGIEHTGRIQIGPAGQSPRVGVVFQHFALLDELSPRENVQLAWDHRPKASADTGPNVLLAELNVPTDGRTALLSGGQRQRLAIARTLAGQPAVVLYDEPTSGLDVATAAQVATVIQQTHHAHGQTSVIVTHDIEALVPIADAVVLFDPAQRALQEIPREQWAALAGMLHPVAVPAESAVRAGSTATTARVASRAGDALATLTRVVEETVLLPWRLLPAWRSPRWGLRFFAHYARIVGGPSAWAYVAIAGAIAGYVTTYFTFRFLPFRKYTEPLIIENLLEAVGFALYRILVPVLITVLVAARCGAAVASDIAGKSYGRQLDALTTLGVRPTAYLLRSILYAMLLAAPLLVAIGYFAAQFVSVAVFTSTHPELGPEFWDAHFHRGLRMPGQWLYVGTSWLLAKTLICAAGIGLIAYFAGKGPKHSSREVSGAITSTILWSTLLVLVVHFAFAFWEF